MENRNTKEAIQKDIDFLAEIKESAIKWKEGNDCVARDMLFTLIDDWSNELSDGITSIEESVLPISDVRLSLPISVKHGSELYAKKLREHYDKEIPDELRYIDGFQDAIRAINELHEGNEA
jgi:hypothetical protein